MLFWEWWRGIVPCTGLHGRFRVATGALLIRPCDLLLNAAMRFYGSFARGHASQANFVPWNVGVGGFGKPERLYSAVSFFFSSAI